MKTTLKKYLPALLGTALLGGDAIAFEYAGLGIGVSPAALRELFPESSHQIAQRGSGSVARPEDGDGRFDQWLKDGDGLYLVRLAPNDTRGDVTGISVSLDKGKVRRWILSFERPGASTRPDQAERRYPGCKRILDTLVDHYGEPASFKTRMEDGLQHRSRVWKGDVGEMVMDCGRYPQRNAIFAIDLEITPR